MNRKLLFNFILLFFFNFCLSQEKPNEIKFGKYSVFFEKPLHELIRQNASNADNPGSYKQIVNASKTTLSAGDSLKINYYISGYGFIDFTSAKLYYSSSANIIDIDKSYITVDFKIVDKLIYYGGLNMPLQNSGLIPLNGVLFTPKDGITTTYFDDFKKAENPYLKAKKDFRPNYDQYIQEHTIIFSEATLGRKNKEEFKSPISFKIKLKEGIPPGDYYYSFVLTYFNGESWENERVEIKLKIMNWYEEYSSLIQWLALLIALMSIITLINPTYKVLANGFKKAKKIKFINKKSKTSEKVKQKIKKKKR
ncbi:hypothetical protein [uncultured Algibacter sp.]|uniref:hypothetical protein n=1 Tax=uncultured Algibacter sp. TaxID=298659 RepID=UPI00260CF58C|nr:hypothetical protein [uncultured Algibacter sp.]